MISAAVVFFSAQLFAASDEAPLLLRGAVVSFGTGRSVTAPLTYDPKRAAQGGFIYADQSLSDSDGERLSEALVLSAANRWSPGASQARARRIPALVLDQARWEGQALVVPMPVFGTPIQSSAGVAYQMVEKTVIRTLQENDAVTVDPERGILVLYPAPVAPSVLAAASALRAFDGLKDGQALVPWVQAHQEDHRAGIFLVAGLAERLALGEAKPEDYKRLKREVESALTKTERGSLSTELARVKKEAQEHGLGFLEEALSMAQEAATLQAYSRVEAQARQRWEGLKALGASNSRIDDVCRQIKALKHKELASTAGDALPEAAALVQAEVPQRVVLGSDLWQRYVRESKIHARFVELEEDASLGLRRKSQRLQTLIAESPIDARSPLGQDILSLLPPSGTYEVSGAFESVAKVAQPEFLGKLLQVWISFWDPGPLGAFRRAGKSEPDISVTVIAEVLADISGKAFSRDPVSGRRDIVVTASKTGQSPDEYTLDRASGLEISPAILGSGKRALQDKDLERLAKACRFVDAHFGRGIELEFVFAKDKLYLLGVRPISGIEDEPVRAPSAIEIPQPEVTIPAVKPVR